MICEVLMYVTFSVSLWSIDDDPIIAGPFVGVRTEPRYQQTGALIVKHQDLSEIIIATQYEDNPQYWWVAETPYTQMSVSLQSVCRK